MKTRAFPVVPSDTNIPDGLLPRGVDYYTGTVFDSRSEAETWGEAIQRHFPQVSYVEYVDES